MRWTILVGTSLLAAVAAALPVRAAEPGDEPAAAPPMTVLVVVVDGLNPVEVHPTTPALWALRQGGTWFPEARATMVAETIPNHVAMWTGVRPDRNGIPANSYWDRTSAGPVTMGDPELVTAETLFTTIGRDCPDLRTASVLSKDYLHTIFGPSSRNRAADSDWDPRPTNIPGSGHSPDLVTTSEVLGRLPGSDVMFVNLGDVDRTGHVDLTGGLPIPGDVRDRVPDLTGDVLTNTALLRQAVLRATDAQLGVLVEALRAAGRWERTVLVVVSDHGMDWSPPLGYITTQPVLDGIAPGRFVVAQNGGADTIYVRDADAPDAPGLLAQARAELLADDRIQAAWYRVPNPEDPDPDAVVPASLGLGTDRAGDLLLVAEPGWRFSDPDELSNPIPGNHGHLVTRHSTFLVAGGHPIVGQGREVAPSMADPDLLTELPEQARNLDVAPTVAWLLGLPTDRYDGRVVTEAFTATDSPTICGQPVAGPGPAPGTDPEGDPSGDPGGPGDGPGAGTDPDGAPATLPATGGTPLPVTAVAVALLATCLLALRHRRQPPTHRPG